MKMIQTFCSFLWPAPERGAIALNFNLGLFAEFLFDNFKIGGIN